MLHGAHAILLEKAVLRGFCAAFVWGMWFLTRPIFRARRRKGNDDSSEDSYRNPLAGGGESLQPFDVTLNSRAEKLVSLVVPAYNEADRFPIMIDAALDYLEEQATRDAEYTYEILVIDDGSTDGTADLVMGYVKRLGTDVVRLCSLHKNQGKGCAVRKGMLRARGRYLLMVDADGATDIRELTKLMEALRSREAEGHGMGVGSRAHMEKESIATRAWYRTIMMQVFHWCVMLLCSRSVRDTQCGFKLFTRDTAKALFSTVHLGGWAFDLELVYLCDKLNIPMVEVPIRWHEVAGSKLIARKLDIITTSISMFRDMLCLRLCYDLGIWRIPPVERQTRGRRRYRSRPSSISESASSTQNTQLR